MRMLIAVKLDPVFKKIQGMYGSRYEILPNVPLFRELQEIILGDDINLVVLDRSLHWRERAEQVLHEAGIPHIIFTGNFDELQQSLSRVVGWGTVPSGAVASVVPIPTDVEQKPDLVSPKPALPREVQTAVHSPEIKQQANEPKIVYVDREVPKYIDREVVRTVEKIVEKPVEIRIEVPVPVEVERQVAVPFLKTMPRQLIVIGSLYSGAGSSFAAIALAKVLDSIRVETCVLEHPSCDPYLYMALDGSRQVPRNYSFLYPQVMANQVQRDAEWQEGNITWMPADPASGKLPEWTGEHMARSLYAIKHAVTILDLSTGWRLPGMLDVLKQADQVLLVAGPDPARLVSQEARLNRSFLSENLGGKVKMIANMVPAAKAVRLKEWIQSLPYPVETMLPLLSQDDIVRASWEGKTIFDENADLLAKYTDAYFSLLREIIPKGLVLERPTSKGFGSWWQRKAGGKGR